MEMAFLTSAKVVVVTAGVVGGFGVPDVDADNVNEVAAAGMVVKGMVNTLDVVSTADEIPTVATESETAVLTLTGPVNLTAFVAGGIGGTFATETTVAAVVVGAAGGGADFTATGSACG